jgi:hypothetical protein
VGSLREALFITVWLRRQEMEVNRTRAMVLAMMEITVKADNTKASGEAFKAFVESAFPFSIKHRGDVDKKMVEAMHKERVKGPILFTPQAMSNPLARIGKTVRVDEEFKKKLQDRISLQRARSRR